MTFGFVLMILNILFDSGSTNNWALAIVFPGVLLRLFCAMYIGKHTSKNRLKADILITSGPYQWTRNPLYLSNGMVSIGLLIYSDIQSMVFFSIILIIPLMLITHLVAKEEEYLKLVHGDIYHTYCQSTPRWFPKWPLIKKMGTANHSFIYAFRTQWFNLAKPILSILLIFTMRHWT